MFKKDDQAYLAIKLKNEKKWHTYWKNPGDAGLSIHFDFKIDNQAVELNELPWPLPKKYLEEGDILTYGYNGANSFFFELSPAQVQKAKNHGVLAHATYLVCKDICIPGESSIMLRPPRLAARAEQRFGRGDERLASKLLAFQKPRDFFEPGRWPRPT